MIRRAAALATDKFVEVARAALELVVYHFLKEAHDHDPSTNQRTVFFFCGTHCF